MTTNRKYLLAAFLTGFFIFLLSALPFAVQNDWVFYFYSDFNAQQIPFTMYFQQQLKGFSLPEFDFFAGSGLDFIEAYGFYNLFSPFTLLMSLFPDGTAVYAIPFFIALKFGCCSMFAYVYASRFCKNNDYALTAALLYAFSGYQMINLVFHYLDALTLFPLLLMSLEAAVTEKKRGFFGVTVAICAITNYYIFGTEVIFIVIYFLVRLTDKAFRINLKDFFCLAAESVLGVLAAGFVLFPAIAALVENPRYDTGFTGIADMLLYESPWRYLRILQAIFLPSDLQGYTNFFPDFGDVYPYGSRWSSQALYIPLFGVSGVIAYITANRKSWLSKLTVICIAVAFVPVLNSIFSLGSPLYYARWMFAPTLIMAVMTMSAFENEPKLFKSGLIINGIIIVAFAVFSIVCPIEKLLLWKPGTYFSIMQIIVQLVLCAAGLFITAVLLFKAARDEFYSKKVVVAVAAFSFVFTEATVLFGMSDTRYPSLVTSVYTDYPQIEKTEYGSRIAADVSFDNSNLYNGNYAIYTFNSTVNPYYMAYCNALEIGSTDINMEYPSECLMSTKTIIVSGHKDEDSPPSGFDEAYTFLRSEENYTLYENPNFIPIGFCYDYCVSEEQLMTLEPEVRAEIMLRAMVLKDVSDAKGYLEVIDSGMLKNMDTEEFAEECALRAENSAESFSTDDDSCTAVITVDKPELVFFSIAYDEDFTAYVDGEQTEIINANIGFMAVPVSEGTHKIELVYHSGIRSIGIAASIAAAIGLMVYITAFSIISRKRRIAQNCTVNIE